MRELKIALGFAFFAVLAIVTVELAAVQIFSGGEIQAKSLAATTPFSGRITNTTGHGVSKATIVVTPDASCTTWAGTTISANTSGFYAGDVDPDCGFTVTVVTRGFTVYSPQSQTFVPVGGALSLYDDINFLAVK